MARKKKIESEQPVSKPKFALPKQWPDYLFFGVLGATFFFLMGFVQVKHNEQTIQKIDVNVSVEFDNHFVEDNDIIKAMTLDNSLGIVGKKYKDIDLKSLEERLESIKFVEDAQISADHQGTLMVEVRQSKPIARIVQPYGPHAYVGSNAATLSTSDKFTARVLIVDGPRATKLMAENYLLTDSVGQQYFQLFQYIEQNEFWKAMIAQCTITENGDVVMLPQIGDYKITLGKPNQLDDKFRKLEIFFKEILPSTGWGRYHSVNVKYKDQLICE